MGKRVTEREGGGEDWDHRVHSGMQLIMQTAVLFNHASFNNLLKPRKNLQLVVKRGMQCM